MITNVFMQQEELDVVWHDHTVSLGFLHLFLKMRFPIGNLFVWLGFLLFLMFYLSRCSTHAGLYLPDSLFILVYTVLPGA